MLISVTVTVLLLALVLYFIGNYAALPSSVPGPTLARFTDLWRAYKQYNGQLRSELVKLHVQHGPLVRYGIKSISISDPSAIDVIYGSRAGFIPADSYNVLVGISNGKEVPSLVSTRDEARHGRLRRSVASAFTAQGAHEYERFVDHSAPDLLDYINDRQNRQIDLAHLLMLYSMDSATRMAFSESLGGLKADQDVGGSIELIRDRFRHWGWWSGAPWLERLLYRNRWAMRRSKGRTPSAMVTLAAKKLKDRSKEEKEGSKDMLTKFIATQEANPSTLDMQGIVSLLMSTISGAGDTTATTMTAVLYFLMKYPAEADKLRAELGRAGVEKQQIPSFSTTSTLPYLAAVIKESMRLFPTPTWPIERLVPAGGIIINGRMIKEGTSVGIFVPSVHLNEATFGEDSAEFRPQRWIDASEEKLRDMEKTFMGFSRGRRVCLGQHVALMQMKKVLPALVMSFDMKPSESNVKLEADMSLAVACLKPLWVTATPRV